MWAEVGFQCALVANLRITGGELRGRAIHCPDGLAVRPTASKVRQAFFNILTGRIEQSSFLDLFAGSGLMGFEALSRGAELVTFVEENKKQAHAIRKSIESFESVISQSGAEAEVVICDVRRVWSQLKGSTYNIVFADPPYKKKYGAYVVAAVMENNLLAEDGLLVIEHFRDDKLGQEEDGDNRKSDLGKYLVDYREYGQTALSFFAHKTVCSDLE